MKKTLFKGIHHCTLQAVDIFTVDNINIQKNKDYQMCVIALLENARHPHNTLLFFEIFNTLYIIVQFICKYQ